MSHQTTPTTKDNTGSSSKEDKSPKVKPFDKDIIASTRDEYEKAVSYSRREKVPYPVFVTEDIFDVITDGDNKVPLFHKGDGTPAGKAVAVIPFDRKDEGLSMLSGGKKIL
jgi:hypothetical protein